MKMKSKINLSTLSIQDKNSTLPSDDIEENLDEFVMKSTLSDELNCAPSTFNFVPETPDQRSCVNFVPETPDLDNSFIIATPCLLYTSPSPRD